MSDLPHVTILGAGVIGLATAATLLGRGHAVTVIDRGEPGGATSRGNASGIAWTDVAPLASPGIWRKAPGWLLDPLGPLSLRPSYAISILPWMLRFMGASRPANWRKSVSAIAALNGAAVPAWERLWSETGSGARVRREGCLDVFDKQREIAGARAGWQLQRDHGIEVHELSGDAMRELEPDLGPGVAGGAFRRALRLVAGQLGRLVRRHGAGGLLVAAVLLVAILGRGFRFVLHDGSFRTGSGGRGGGDQPIRRPITRAV